MWDGFTGVPSMVDIGLWAVVIVLYIASDLIHPSSLPNFLTTGPLLQIRGC